MKVSDMKVELNISVSKVLIHPSLFSKMLGRGDMTLRHEDTMYLLWNKYPVVADSSAEDIEFKFNYSMKDIINGKDNKGEIGVRV